MAALVGTVSPFDGETQLWEEYIEMLEFFFQANGIEDAGKKKAVLLSGDNDEEAGLEQLVMAVIVKNGSSRSGSPRDAGIVIEALKVFPGHVLSSLDWIGSIESPVSQASFEVFQKLFLELDSSKFIN